MLKQIKYTDHALEQIKLRGLEIKMVEDIIKYPQQKFSDGDDTKRTICQSIINIKNNKNKIIRVVIEELEKYILVVTSYRSSNIKKYWRE